MKISQLVKRTGVPKETIHFYIREGLLRKPRKSGVNSAEYNETYVDQIQLIKDLRDNYYLPIPEIKKIVKDFRKQSPSDQAVSQFHSRFFRPADRLFANEIQRGVEIKWFGAKEPIGFTSSWESWQYVKEAQPLPRTRKILDFMCDFRVPLTFSLDDCKIVAAVIRQVAGEIFLK